MISEVLPILIAWLGGVVGGYALCNLRARKWHRAIKNASLGRSAVVLWRRKLYAVRRISN